MSNERDRKRRKQLYKKQKRRCHWCGKTCFMSNPRRGTIPKNHVLFTLDHVIPRSRGGPDILSNIVGACSPCNHLRDYVETKLKYGKKPPFVVKAKYLPVGFVKF